MTFDRLGRPIRFCPSAGPSRLFPQEGPSRLFPQERPSRFLPSLPKRRAFVSYCHKDDQEWYDALSAFGDWLDLFSDRSLGEPVRSDDPEYVNRAIREERIVGSSVTIVLCGSWTYGRKYVDWEIRSTLHHSHGLLGVALPSARRGASGNVIVPGRLHDNITTGYAVWMGAWSWEPEAWKSAIEDAYQRSQTSGVLINNARLKMTLNSA